MGYGRCFGFVLCFGVLVGSVLVLRSCGKGFWKLRVKDNWLVRWYGVFDIYGMMVVTGH